LITDTSLQFKTRLIEMKQTAEGEGDKEGEEDVYPARQQGQLEVLLPLRMAAVSAAADQAICMDYTRKI
jgi:hypothetical protein